MDIFEILGINSREDSYTDLLYYAFKTDKHFKTNFCLFFAQEYSNDYELIVRSSLVHIDLNRPGATTTSRKEVPDMLLISKDNNRIILIENKIFSLEGYNQTKRYSSSKFIQSVKSKFSLPHAEFNKFYYMTLDGSKAVSSKFEPVKWSKFIIQCCDNIKSDDKRLNILMYDLLDRSNHYEKSCKYSGSSIFLDYFNNIDKWVNSRKAFEDLFSNLGNEIVKRFKFINYEFSQANNRSGNQYLMVFRNSEWEKSKLPNNFDKTCFETSNIELFSNSRSIHIELNWLEKLNKVSLMIHYELHPYITYKSAKKEFSEFLPEYNKKRSAFIRLLYKNKKSNWKKIGRFLTVIKIEKQVNAMTTINDVFCWVNNNFEDAICSIEKSLLDEKSNS